MTLATPPQRAEPTVDDVIAERVDGRVVAGHSVAGEEPTHDCAKPFPLLDEWRMQPPPKLILDVPQFGLHAFARRPAPELEARTLLVHSTDMCEAEKVERLGLTLAAPGPVGGSVSAELDQARLLWMQCEFSCPSGTP